MIPANEPVDTAFRDAVFAAVAGRGERLALILRSAAPLGSSERELLAMWAEGWRRSPGKRSRFTPSTQRWVAVFYVERIEAGEASDSILADLRDIFSVERSTVLGWVKEIRDFEEHFPEYAERYRDDVKRTFG